MRELDWFDGPEDDGDGERRRSRWFPMLVAVPWLVVAALLVAPRLADAPSDREAPRASGTTDPAEPAPSDDAVRPAGPEPGAPIPDTAPPQGAGTEPARPGSPGSAAPTEPSAAGADALPAGPEDPAAVLEVAELRGRWRVAPGSEEAASLAVVVARAWLTGLEPALELEGVTAPAPRREGSRSYAEHLIVEAVEATSPDTEVVTVLAVVLHEQPGADPAVTVERLAVPIAWTEDRPHPAGPPWPLPGPRLDARPPALQPVTEEEMWDQANDALAQAGLGALRLTAVRTAPRGPLVVTASDGTQEHEIWLRRHLDGYVVAGSTLQGSDPLQEEQQQEWEEGR
ncbi:MAG: hypothetical protein ACLFUG_01840 [Nitriliruptoraceae bacterium]